jgi:hypothetical protein
VQVRRERRLESNLAKLRKLCIEVGADDAEVAASVHHTLRNYHETMRGHYYTYSKAGEDISAPDAPAQVRACSETRHHTAQAGSLARCAAALS